MKFLVSLVGLVLAVLCKGEYTCLSCKNIVSARDCSVIERCGQYGECYTEQFFNSLGYLRYNLGCRDTVQCLNGISVAVGKRQSGGDHVICSQCCTGDLCNNHGCKQQGYPPLTDRGPICFSCSKELSPTSCNAIHICRKGDVCKVKGGISSENSQVRYELKCEPKATCYSELQFFQTPGLAISHFVTIGSSCIIGCCDTDLCNSGCTNTTSHPVTSATITTPTVKNHCDLRPCIHGTCYSNQNGFVCICDPGFTGSRCSTILDFCTSNPCDHGACYSNRNGYVCVCSPGYTGTICDTAIDFCSANPCHNGRCTNTQTGFTCTCNHGFAGKTCDTVLDFCTPDPCNHHGQCTNSPNGFTCACGIGYTGKTCTSGYSCQNDIVFVVDESASIGATAFNTVIDFISDLVRRLTIGIHETQIGLLVYGNLPHLQWFLNAYTSKTALLGALTYVPYHDGTSRTDLALQYVRQNMFQHKTGDRILAKNIVVVITDGRSTSHSATVEEAKTFRAQGVTVVAIGVGNSKDHELFDLATNASYAIKVVAIDHIPAAIPIVLPLICS